MEIEKLDDYSNIIYRLANHFEEFEEFVENQTSSDTVRDLFDAEEYENIDIPKRRYAKKHLICKYK